LLQLINIGNRCSGGRGESYGDFCSRQLQSALRRTAGQQQVVVIVTVRRCLYDRP